LVTIPLHTPPVTVLRPYRIFQFKGLSTWPILKFVGKDILKFVGNFRRALSMAWLISGGRLIETRGGFSAEC